MARWKIEQNRNVSSDYDMKMEGAEGDYDSLSSAMNAVSGMELVTLPDGSLWVYDPDCEGIADDIAGYNALATISMVVE